MFNPCTSCGACCATLRVSFYRGEVVPGPESVPEALVVDVSPFLVAMKGTERRPTRCVALLGVVGESTQCAIYPRRPSTCRAFAPSGADGMPQPDCDKARLARGLVPLPCGSMPPRRFEPCHSP